MIKYNFLKEDPSCHVEEGVKSIRIFKERLDLAKLSFSDNIEKVYIFAFVLELDSEKQIKIPGVELYIFAFKVEVKGSVLLEHQGYLNCSFLKNLKSDSLKLGAPVYYKDKLIASRPSYYLNPMGNDVPPLTWTGAPYEWLGNRTALDPNSRYCNYRYIEVGKRRPMMAPATNILASGLSIFIFDNHIENFVGELESSLMSARLYLVLASINKDVECKSFFIEYLKWILNITEDYKRNAAFKNIRTKAVSLLIRFNFPSNTVPYLSYKVFEDRIKKIDNLLGTEISRISQFEQTDTLYKALEIINKNVGKVGDAEIGYIKAMYSHEKRMTDYYQFNVDEQHKELKDKIEKRAEILKQLKAKQKDFKKSIDDYKDAVKKEIKKEVVSCVIGVVAAVFTAGASLVASLSDVNAFQKIADTLSALGSLFDLFTNIEDWTDTNDFEGKLDLDKLNEDQLKLPDQSKWEDMTLDFNASLDSGMDVGAKEFVKADWQKIVNRVKELCIICSEISQTKLEIKKNEILKKDAELFQNDLGKYVDIKFDKIPNIESSNIIRKLKSSAHEVMIQFLETFCLLDMAMQYEFFQKHSLVDKSDLNLIDLRQKIIQQNDNFISAIEHHRSQRVNINYDLNGIPVVDLINGNKHTFRINVDNTIFGGYQRIRVIDVEVIIRTRKTSTSSEKYRLLLKFDGHPFYDKKEAENITYITDSRLFIDDFDADTNEKLTKHPSSGSLDKFISRVTPYSNWSIWFPENTDKNLINKDLSFHADTLDFTLKFYLDTEFFNKLENKEVLYEQM